MNDSDKHAYLIRYEINNGLKSFIIQAPDTIWALEVTVTSALNLKMTAKYPVDNDIKLFWRNYVVVGATLVNIKVKYATSDVNYAEKGFIILAKGLMIIFIWSLTNDMCW